MEKYINDIGKICYRRIEEHTPFEKSLFHNVEDMLKHDSQIAFHSNLGSLTVVDRLTGFGWRDIETGYRDNEGVFWLASGNYDVTRSGCKTVGEAIQWVKKHANNCVALKP